MTTQPQLPEIDVAPLERATSQLEKALQARQISPTDEFIRDAVIQRFEFTCELSIKMIRRYLKTIAATEDEVDILTFRELIRRATDLKLLQADISDWMRFRQARTDTVHTYNEIRAVDVAGATAKFAIEARTLLNVLKERIQP
jgi:nucleotidyltransferase substrate binding protein (TIGR01987 family)